MHILVFPSFYPSKIRPVTGIFFKDQVEALRHDGHRVNVLSAPRIREMLSYMRHKKRLPAFVDEGDGIYRMQQGWFPRIFPEICAPLHKNAGLKAFEQYIQAEGKPDIIHAHNIFYSGYMAVEIKRKYDIPVVMTEHATNFLRGRIFLPGQHRIATHTLQNIDAALAVGAALKNHLATRYKASVAVVPNLINVDFFEATPKPPEPFTFALVARLFKIKNIPLLLDAFHQAFKDENVKLSIAGDGPDKEKLQAQVQRLGLQAQVTFHGKLLRPDVRDLMINSHAIVSSSWIETFGVTMIEAMACGRPVVATRSGGPEGFVTPAVGILTEQTVDDLAQGMRQLYENYDQYDPMIIRDYCVEHFSEAAVVRQLNAVYQSVMSSS